MAEPRKPATSRGAAKRTSGKSNAAKTINSTNKISSAKNSDGARKRPALGKSVSPEQRWKLIADAAFFKAENRGFAPGGEVADWLAAEMEVDALLRGKAKKSAKGH